MMVELTFKRVVVVLGALLALMTTASGECVALWPVGKMPYQAENQTTVPTVEWFEPQGAAPRHELILYVPGGGYEMIGGRWSREHVCRHYARRGYHTAFLTYRTPRPKGMEIYRTGWVDGQRAIRLIRNEAAKRGYDSERIGVIGTSAGAHLAMLLATSSQTPAYEPVDEVDSVPTHVNWAAPLFCAYALDDGLSGANAKKCRGAHLTKAFRFDARTPPTCLFHGGADVHSPLGSVAIYRKLHEMGIPAELHLLADRPHDFQVRAEPGTPSATWSDRLDEFLFTLRAGKPHPVLDDLSLRVFPDATVRTEKVPLRPASGDGAYLVWYVPERKTTDAIHLIVPGGGYALVDFNREGQLAAYDANRRGMTAVVLKYRPDRTLALADLKLAGEMVRKGAAARDLDPGRVGLMGFSAGAHLALRAATASDGFRPAWVVAVYPAYLPDKDIAFTAETPPVCFLHGDRDTYSPLGSVDSWERLHDLGVQCELHTFATCGHDFHITAAKGTGARTMFDRVWEFLVQKKFR